METAPWNGIAVRSTRWVLRVRRAERAGRAKRPGPRRPPQGCLVALLGAGGHRHLQTAELERAGGGRPRRLLHVGQRGRLGLLGEPVGVGLLAAALHARTLGGVLGGNTDVDVLERRVSAEVLD